MLSKIKKTILPDLKVLGQAIRYSGLYLLHGIKRKSFWRSAAYLKRQFIGNLQTYFLANLKSCLTEQRILPPDQETGLITNHSLKKIAFGSQGLHSLLPSSKAICYSVFVVTRNVESEHAQKLIESAFAMTAPNMELLIEIKNESESAFVDEMVQKYTKTCHKIESGDSLELMNTMAEKAAGNYFLLVHADWLRPDLLFRFEQTLLLHKNPEDTVLHSYSYRLNQFGELFSDHHETNFYFPYHFCTAFPACVLISKSMWDKVGGLRREFAGAHLYDLMLRLDLAGAHFEKIPVYLFLQRKVDFPQANMPIAIKALQDYVHQKNLAWEITQGYLSNTLRAIPVCNGKPSVHVVIPYKDHKALTLAAVKSALAQKHVQVHITAVDNRSTDQSIAVELSERGVEVLHVDEPFNFARINNLAIERSQFTDCPLVFFMNNDVEMDSEALYEMCRWTEQPHVGMVGARLNYPNGLLQCGGIDKEQRMIGWKSIWHLTENKLPFEKLSVQLNIRVADGVTAAAALMKKELFLKVGGFDEIWYPNTYSDTLLALKLKDAGYSCLYTPYAVGIHHESLTRATDSYDDYDMSHWLELKYFQQKPYITT